jgi:predicted dehydrogenase
LAEIASPDYIRPFLDSAPNRHRVIRLGIVGCNYGRIVQLPAFRTDRRCEVIALAGSDEARTARMAEECEIPHAFGSWADLVGDGRVDAVAVATPPTLQPQIAMRALSLGKPVFVEKPLAPTATEAAAMLHKAREVRRPTMIDFEFAEIMAWQRAKSLLEAGALGRLRHVHVLWNVENAATRLRLKGWKTSRSAGGGVLGNFVCHSFHYLERFGGPLVGLSARLSSPPGRDADEKSTVALALEFQSGASGSLTMSCASYLGSGHRLEFYGDDGTLVLVNECTDYMRGFRLLHATRPATSLTEIPLQDPLDAGFVDGRIAPMARLVQRFFDAVEANGECVPSFAAGYRVQQLMDAAQRSHDLGRWLDVTPETAA